MAWLLFLLLGCGATVATDVVIDVSPSTDQFIADNSAENVTFSCDARETGGSSGSSAVWTVQGRQIPNDPQPENPTRRAFEDLGVFISVMEPGLTEVIITNLARTSFLNSQTTPTPNITVLCSSFVGSFGTVDGDMLTVTTFGIPTNPTQLLLDPNPGNFDELLFSWVAPEGQFAGVNISYSVNISGPSLNMTNEVMETFITFDNDATLGCEPHLFSVFASNDAGSGPIATVMDTIPISPDISDIDLEFQISDVSVTSEITLTLFVPRAVTCNLRFPILNYSLSIPSLMVNMPLNFGPGDGPFTGSVPVTALEMDEVYSVFIDVCISITCRRSLSRILRTTDVQEASIIFFGTNIFLNCTFASNSDARGCQFRFMLVNEQMEDFFLPQSPSSSSVMQCNQTMNQADAYVSFIAADWEADGSLGMQSQIVLTPLFNFDNADDYTDLTGCSIPVPRSPLSGGAIAGIVIAVLIAGTVVLAVVLVVVVYRIRTGHWFKLREKDEDKLTVHFEKALLMGDLKPAKKSRVGASKRSGGWRQNGHNSPDIGEEMTDSANSAQEVGTEEHDLGLATNPQNAFTLDISSDRNKVKLHLNRALIKKVLLDNKLNTVERRKARRQTSISKQHLLPLQCEVRVQVEEDKK